MNPDPTTPTSEALLAHMEWVRELARRLVHDPSSADDVAQEVWMAAVERPPAPTSDVRSWLKVVTRRVVQGMGRSASRRQRREAQAARAEAEPDHSDVLARGETCQRLVAAVMALDEPYRSTVLHRYLDGLSTKQIAALDRVTELVVRKRLSRAMYQLRTRLDEEFEGGRRAWMAALAGLRHPASSALAVGVGLGGLLLMKKALVLVVVALVLALVWFESPVRQWLEKQPDKNAAHTMAVAGSSQARSGLDAPVSSGPSRSNAVPDSGTQTTLLAVDGVVLNIPYPDTSLAPTPASDVEVTLRVQDTGFPPTQIKAVTRSGGDGRFHVELANPGLRIGYIYAAGDPRYRTVSKNLNLDDTALLRDYRLERAAHGDLSGLVVSDDGRPLAGVSVIWDRDQRHGLSNLGSGGANTPAQQAPGVNAEPNAVVTDSLGAFTFTNVHAADSFAPGVHGIFVVKEGLRMLPIGPAEPSLRGGWKLMKIRMIAGGGRIAVRVRDENDRPQSNVRIGVAVSTAEPGANWESWDSHSQVIHELTDDEGRAVLDDVWVGKKLDLEVGSDFGSWTCQRALDGRIDLRAPVQGRAITVPSSNTLDLQIVLPTGIKLLGTVVDRNGQDVANSLVKLRARGPAGAKMYLPYQIKSDTNGQFAQVLARPSEPFTLDIAAKAEGVGPDGATSAMTGKSLIEVTPGSPVEVPVRIELQPALAISGSVHEKDGRPCEGRVVAIPLGAQAVEYSRGAGSPIGPDGRFEERDLLPGVYDIEVRPARNSLFTDCLLSQRFPAIAAGTRDVQLVLGDDKEVNVEIEVAAAEGKVASMAVLTGIFYPYKERDPVGHTPEGHQTFSGSYGWPEDATLDFGGQSGGVNSEGFTAFLHLGADVPLHHLKPMNAGWYCFGVDARDSSGQPYHTCGTGLVYLTPGSYHFHFDLVHQSTLEGRITASTRRDDLCIELFTLEGKAVQVLRTSRYVGDVMQVGENGRFSLDGVPVGGLLLRVGPEKMLRSGKSIYEQRITVGAGENAAISIDLP